MDTKFCNEEDRDSSCPHHWDYLNAVWLLCTYSQAHTCSLLFLSYLLILFFFSHLIINLYQLYKLVNKFITSVVCGECSNLHTALTEHSDILLPNPGPVACCSKTQAGGKKSLLYFGCWQWWGFGEGADACPKADSHPPQTPSTIRV